ncbi:MAG: 30S ribosomal protein S7 [Armatimonadetes bacterium]|nr:30S ribosomal protein S7 [Armatimonadota bacterium]
MPRKGPAKKRDIVPDPLYGSRMLTRLINRVLLSGKKSVAEKIVYGALDMIEEKTKRPGIEVFEEALRNVMPIIEVKPRRVGGSTYQVPVEVRSDRKVSLAMRWIVTYARRRGGHTMMERLAAELLDASNNTGASIKKKEDGHKMAEANKAFAHYRY